MRPFDDVERMLTAPGAPFEVAVETVRGIEMRVYRHRMRSLREVAARALRRGDDRDFLVYGRRRWGFAEFVRHANSVSDTLAARWGVRPGDRVAVLSANNPEWCFAFWGAVDAGAVLVGLNGWWKTDEIAYALRHCGARVLVADRKRFERVAPALGDLRHIEAVFLVDPPPHTPGVDARVRPFAELLRSPSDRLPDVPIAEDDAAVIFYTSGTTGRPKGAISTHRSMIANLQNTLYNAVATAMRSGVPPAVGEREQNVALLTAPLFHVSGCHSNLVVGLMAGTRLVIPEGRFDPEQVMRLIERERVTVWAAVPTMVWRVVEHPARHRYDLGSVTTVAYGGSPAAVELARRVRETFPNVRTMSNAYGLTESSSVATVNAGRDFEERPDSVGRPLPIVDVRIVGENGRVLPAGRPGEIQIRGPNVMPGYWNDPEATAATVVDGWLRTGDIGYLDADGFLYVTDRAKDMIIRGGENIYCVEIENRLVEHPDILDAAVVGVEHPTLGEEVKAVVQVRPGARLSADDVREWVRATLADFKVPRYVEFRADPLPRNASGKLLKNLLRGRGEVSFAETM